MKGLKNTAIVIIIIGALLSIIPIIFYLDNFGHNNLAADTRVWGVFGDFIGGTINPIIGLMNLALLVAISIYVAKFDNHRQFNEYRFHTYIELCEKFDNAEYTSDSLDELKENMKIFSFNNQFLFPRESIKIFTKIMNELIDNIEKLIPIKEDIEEKVRIGVIRDIPISRKMGRELEATFKNLPAIDDKESLALRLFSASKKRILGFIQAVMIEGDIKKYCPTQTP